MTKGSTHWGEWILARSQAVGIKRKKDLAAAVGCNDNQLTRWLQMDRPPIQMRKGFDSSLVAALKTDRTTLFSNFKTIHPSVAPLIEPSDRPDVDAGEIMRRRVQAMVELMPDDGLKELARVGEILLRSGNVMQIA